VASKRNLLVNLIAGTVAVAILVWFAALTWTQVGYWHDSTTLWSHTLSITENNHVAHGNYGQAIENHGKVIQDKGDVSGALRHYEEAIRHYEEAVRIKPNFADAHYNLGMMRARQGNLEAAAHHLYQAVHFDPREPQRHRYLQEALFQYGAALKQAGKPAEALKQYQEAVRLYPDNPKARNNLGVTLAQQGKLAEAREQFAITLWLSPGDAEASHNLRAVDQLQAKPAGGT
jgi:protein O-mannosyl-transferase